MDSFTPVVHDSFRRSISKNPHLLLDENSVKIFGGNAMDVLNRGGMRKRVSPGGGMAECATLENAPLNTPLSSIIKKLTELQGVEF